MQLSVHLFLFVWVPGLFRFGLCQENCRVQDGKPGKEGVPGRDGWPGQKGEKGEPGLQVQLSKQSLIDLKGDVGEEGPNGEIGPRGYNGKLGPPGPSGPPGPPGRYNSGSSSGNSNAMKEAFSVVRTKVDPPQYKTPLIFEKELTNVNRNFNVNTGEFVCNIPGTYYFAFHAASEGDLCLQLRSNNDKNLSLNFCDFSLRQTSHVLSGGVVIELKRNDKVWIEPVKNPEPKTNADVPATKIETCVFNGFLIFASSN